MHPAVDPANETREGRGSVPSEGPKGSAGSDIAATCCDDGWQESHDQQSESATSGARGLVVDLGERETVNAGDDLFEIVDRVEKSNHIKDTADETNAHLGQDGLRDVSAGSI